MGSIEETCNANGKRHREEGEDLNIAEKAHKAVGDARNYVEDLLSTDKDAGVSKDDPHALHAGILGDLASQADRIPENISMLLDGAEAAKNGGLVDDKKMLMEKIIQTAASLPSDSPFRQKLSSQLIDTLWNGIPHPPTSYVSDEWKYRSADGSNNNKTMPWLGKAGSTYARSVEPKAMQSPTRPDPGLIFDELLARGPEAREHPNKVSSLLFYLATIIVHDIFRTSDLDWTKADNSSYLDLSPLYGNSIESQHKVRTLQDGKLKPDTFSEVRLLGFPPGVAALLCAFNRFHNYVAEQLSQINEGERFTLIPLGKWNSSAFAAQRKQHPTPEAKRDHDLFNTARLVTCGLYVNIILEDYVRTILNLNTTNSSWSLDPRQETGKLKTPEATGNQVSVEFNLVYRWHSAISVKDEKWTEEFLKEQLGDDRDVSALSVEDFLAASKKFGHSFKDKDPGTWPLGKLERQKDGSFKSEELVELLTQATEDCAASFGARNVPVALRAIEILGIEQSRKWNVATLNEFRQFFGMLPHKSFSDITSQPDVAASLETLYGSPDAVELYSGLIVEDGKPVMEPGSGLCPGYTISKAILCDATTLVRGDRFYTQEYNPSNLTNWGYNISSSNPQIAGGGVIYKLFYRAFPGFYPASSAYAYYPFQTPEKTKENLQSLGQAQDYNFSRPAAAPQPKVINTWQACTAILSDHENFKVPWGSKIKDLTLGREYCHAGDMPWHSKQHAFIDKAIYCPHAWKGEIRSLYEEITRELLASNAHKLRSGYQIDLVQDIADPASTRAMARLFNTPLKTTPDEKNSHLTEKELYDLMASIFRYIFANSDECDAHALRQEALHAAAIIRPLIEHVVEENDSHATDNYPFGTQLIRRFLNTPGEGDIPTLILCTLSEALTSGSQSLTQILDLLFSEPYHSTHWPEICRLAEQNEDEKLEKYILECLRISTPVFALPRLCTTSTTILDGEAELQLKEGEAIILNLQSASLDPTIFPSPHEIHLNRPDEKYIHHGWGAHACIGRGLITTALATQLKLLARECKNLRRAPGMQGQVKRLGRGFMTETWDRAWPFPTGVRVLWD